MQENVSHSGGLGKTSRSNSQASEDVKLSSAASTMRVYAPHTGFYNRRENGPSAVELHDVDALLEEKINAFVSAVSRHALRANFETFVNNLNLNQKKSDKNDQTTGKDDQLAYDKLTGKLGYATASYATDDRRLQRSDLE